MIKRFSIRIITIGVLAAFNSSQGKSEGVSELSQSEPPDQLTLTGWRIPVYANSTREYEMAKLLFDEQFIDKDIASRGWDKAETNIQHIDDVYDSTLNKNVIYWSWVDGSRGMPNQHVKSSGAGTFGHSLTPDQWNTGFTIHTTVKFHNYLLNGIAGGNHAPLRGNPSGYLGNGEGEFSLDPFRKGRGSVTFPKNNSDVDLTFSMQYDHSRPAGVSPEWRNDVEGSNATWWDNDRAEELGPYLTDDVWYEFVTYMYPNNGEVGQRSAAWYRPYGTTDWIWLWDFHKEDGHRFFTIPASNPYIGLGPYFHVNYSTDEVRVYTSNVTVWTGDAMADGMIDDAGGGNPIPPPVLRLSTLAVGISVDELSRPHIVTYDSETGELIYMVKEGGTWSKEILP